MLINNYSELLAAEVFLL